MRKYGTTGQDLNLTTGMATSEVYLAPLRKFRMRLAVGQCAYRPRCPRDLSWILVPKFVLSALCRDGGRNKNATASRWFSLLLPSLDYHYQTDAKGRS